jgi:hypothetical protein
MAKTKSSMPDVAAKTGIHPAVEGFLERLTGDPDFKRMNPGVKFVDGKFVDVPVDPPKVVPLPDPGGKRRDRAMTEVTCQLEAIFNGLIALSSFFPPPIPTGVRVYTTRRTMGQRTQRDDE